MQAHQACNVTTKYKWDVINIEDLVLINPHTLKLVDISGTGKKLVQKTIRPFEVLEKINLMAFQLHLPNLCSILLISKSIGLLFLNLAINLCSFLHMISWLLQNMKLRLF